MNFFKITDRKSGVKDRGSIVNCKEGFTLTEMIIVMAIIGILAGIAFSTMRTPNEQIACKEIYSNLQLAKMKAVSTGVDVTVDIFTEILNVMEDVTWSQEVDYLTSEPTSLAWGVSIPWPNNGVDFDGAGGTQTTFTPKGMVGTSGSVYLKNVDDTFRLCAVSVLATGIVRMATSNDTGATWN